MCILAFFYRTSISVATLNRDVKTAISQLKKDTAVPINHFKMFRVIAFTFRVIAKKTKPPMTHFNEVIKNDLFFSYWYMNSSNRPL